jgi:hypothetical protein
VWQWDHFGLKERDGADTLIADEYDRDVSGAFCAFPLFHLPLTLGAYCATQCSQSVSLLKAQTQFSQKRSL